VTVVQQAKELAAAVKPMSLAEKVEYLTSHEVPMSSLVKVLQRYPQNTTKGYVPGFRIHWHRRVVNEVTGEVTIDAKWTTRTCTPKLWIKNPQYKFGLVPDSPAS